MTIGQGAAETIDPVQKDFRVSVFGELKVQERLVSQVVKPRSEKPWCAQGLTLGHGTGSYGDPLREALKEYGIL